MCFYEAAMRRVRSVIWTSIWNVTDYHSSVVRFTTPTIKLSAAQHTKNFHLSKYVFRLIFRLTTNRIFCDERSLL